MHMNKQLNATVGPDSFRSARLFPNTRKLLAVTYQHLSALFSPHKPPFFSLGSCPASGAVTLLRKHKTATQNYLVAEFFFRSPCDD